MIGSPASALLGYAMAYDILVCWPRYKQSWKVIKALQMSHFFSSIKFMQVKCFVIDVIKYLWQSLSLSFFLSVHELYTYIRVCVPRYQHGITFSQNFISFNFVKLALWKVLQLTAHIFHIHLFHWGLSISTTPHLLFPCCCCWWAKLRTLSNR